MWIWGVGKALRQECASTFEARAERVSGRVLVGGSRARALALTLSDMGGEQRRNRNCLCRYSSALAAGSGRHWRGLGLR